MRGLWTLAGLAMLVGAILTVTTLRQAGQARIRLAALGRDLEGLQRLDARLGSYLAAQTAFEQLATPKAAGLADVLERTLPGCKLDQSKEVSSQPTPGWVLRRQEISLSDVPFAKVMEFVRAAEAQRPPWRLAKFTIRASAREPGTGQAVLQMEALERAR